MFEGSGRGSKQGSVAGEIGRPELRARDLSEVICFKCGRKGHYQIGCLNAPVCFSCKEEGHTANQCPNRVTKPELILHGFGIKGMGFYALEGGRGR